MWIAQWVFTNHKKFQINTCTTIFITEMLVKGALLHWWMSLLCCCLYSTYFKSKNCGLSVQMKISQLTFLDSAYSKYENKLKLPLLPKKCTHISFLGIFFQYFVQTIIMKHHKDNKISTFWPRCSVVCLNPYLFLFVVHVPIKLGKYIRDPLGIVRRCI